MIDSQNGAAQVATGHIDRRIRHAMRILENEQTPLPETAEVAARVGMSLFYFVRLFGEQVGLSPQEYGRSLIMMHSASRLRYSVEPIDVVARDFGYAKQATFNKAFTNHHGLAPARWRRKAQAEIVPVSGEGVRLVECPAQRCLARRYLGPRHLTRAQWADFSDRLPAGLRDHPRLGFTYDDPRVTPPARIRHDCAVEVADDAVLPEDLADDGFELLESPAGLWAMKDVMPAKVAEGYRAIFDGWFQGRPDYAMEGDPFLERHGRTPEGEAIVTICVRVRPIVEEGDFNMAVLPPDAPTDKAP
jgi:AraC-like DNA-binding protein/DNA gyrase inhibitor GyrI